MLPRHDNVIWQQLGSDELWASLIVDGQHLPPPVVRCMLRAKTPARTVLTCDASSLAGLPPGRYREWGQDLEITPAGRIVVAGTPYLAGSWAFLDHCVRSAMSIAGIDLAQAIGMASIQPRELLGLPCHRLEPGHPADLVLFERDVNGLPWVRDTLVGGVHHPFKTDLQEPENDAARASNRGTPPACGNA
jgi:N-acetylglucosamine-6-phosphate deacetylase